MNLTKKVYIATARDIGEKCKIWASENMREGFELVEDLESSDIVVSILYDKIFKPNIVIEKQCYNFHPGILPEYKGCGICSWAIINEEKYMGATLCVIDENIDTGDIIDIRKFPIQKEDTSLSLFKKTEELIYDMFTDWFYKLLQVDYVSCPQLKLKNNRIYYKKDLKNAMDLTKFARAFYFPGKPSAYYYDSSGKKKDISF